MIYFSGWSVPIAAGPCSSRSARALCGRSMPVAVGLCLSLSVCARHGRSVPIAAGPCSSRSVRAYRGQSVPVAAGQCPSLCTALISVCFYSRERLYGQELISRALIRLSGMSEAIISNYSVTGPDAVGLLLFVWRSLKPRKKQKGALD